jgi:hypothetical protein
MSPAFSTHGLKTGPFNPGNLRPCSDWLLWIVIAGAALYTAGFLFVLCRDIGNRMEDFDAYYYRTRAYAQGQNPYDPAPMMVEHDKRIGGKYLYPPMTLPVIGLAHEFSRPVSGLLFFGLKCLCLAVVIWLWVTQFNPAGVDGRILAIALLLAFGRCIGKDFDTGNIVIFEQLGIWLAMLCFLRRQWFWYAGLIALVSVFKVTPLMLLGLCFMQKDRRAWIAAVATALIYAGVLFCPLLNPSPLLAGFFSLAPTRDERGSVNPSSLAALRDLAEAVWGKSTDAVWNNPGTFIYAFFALVVAGLALAVLVRRRWQLNLFDTMMLGIFTYALCAPRFKDYSYILMIMPALYVVWTCLRSDLLRLIVVVLMCFHFYRYQQWSVMAALFLVYVVHLLRDSAGELAARPKKQDLVAERAI